jgi:hypothetical protein
MLEIPANPQPLAERIDKLEREHRNLLARMEKLEKRSGSILFEVVRTSLLLIVAALVLHLMGLLPRGLERLNVLAKEVHADRIKAEQMEVNELILQDRKGASRAKLGVQDAEPGLTFFDPSGRVTSEVPAKVKP